MTDLTTKAAEIRAGLEGVTPGPWFVSGARFKMNGGAWHSINRYDESRKQDENVACVGFDPRDGVGLKDVHHIARLDPATVLAFLDERAEHLATIARLEGRLEFALGEGTSWAIKAGLSERRATTAKQAERLKEMEAALGVIVGCFDAAYAEGLQERLAEADNDIGSLRDLVERRLLFAHSAARALTEGGAEHG